MDLPRQTTTLKTIYPNKLQVASPDFYIKLQKKDLVVPDSVKY